MALCVALLRPQEKHMDMYLIGQKVSTCMTTYDIFGQAFDLRVAFNADQWVIFNAFIYEGVLKTRDFVELMVATGYTTAPSLLCLVDQFTKGV